MLENNFCLFLVLFVSTVFFIILKSICKYIITFLDFGVKVWKNASACHRTDVPLAADQMHLLRSQFIFYR